MWWASVQAAGRPQPGGTPCTKCLGEEGAAAVAGVEGAAQAPRDEAGGAADVEGVAVVVHDDGGDGGVAGHYGGKTGADRAQPRHPRGAAPDERSRSVVGVACVVVI